jgi:mersacidin/lichenicidin family type 2 lantibiotic
MNAIDVVRAWKDEDYRANLTAEQQAALPANPAGLVELTDEMLQAVSGTGPCQTTYTSGFSCTCGSCRSCWSTRPCCC